MTPLDTLGNGEQVLRPINLFSKFILLRKGGFGEAARPEHWLMNGEVWVVFCTQKPKAGCLLLEGILYPFWVALF